MYLLESETVSKRKFEAIDLIILTAVSCIIEAVILWAYNSFGKYDGYVASFIVVIGLIAIYRWNLLGIIVPILSGLVTVLMRSINGSVNLGFILAYTIGYLPMLINLLWFKFNDKVEMSRNLTKLYGYFLTGFLLVEIGRTLCIVIGTSDIQDIGKILYSYLVWDLLNLVFSALIFFIAIKQKKIVYDMNAYLLEMSKENETSMIRKDIDDYLSLEQMAEDSDVSDISLLDGGNLTNDDLKKLNETYQKMTGKESKYVKEQKAIDEYHKNKNGGKTK